MVCNGNKAALLLYFQMVGFGTKNVDLQAFATTFTSLLGKDSDSWGLSYTGNIIHNGLKRQVCKAFGKGVTIGVHLDMWLGKMSLFRNGNFVGKYDIL